MTTTATPGTTNRATRGGAGAPLLPPTLAYLVLTVLGVAVPGLVAGVRPWQSDAALLDFFQHHSGAAHAAAFLTLGAAIPLAVFTAVATTRLRTLGLDVPGRIIAQIGGTVASAMLALAGVTTLAATRANVQDSPAAVRALWGITFAAGGPAFVVFTGLLVAGISIAGWVGRVLPTAIGWIGLAVAAVCELGSLASGWDGLDVLLPIGRFGSLAWIVALGFILPATRREWRARRGIVRSAEQT